MANINIIDYWNALDNIPALPYIGVDGDTLVISVPGTRNIGEGYINYLQNRLITYNAVTGIWKYDGDSTQVSIVTGPTGTLPEIGTTIPLELNYLGSVGLSAPYWYTVENSPLTTNGTIAVVPNQGLPPGKVLATPSTGIGPLDLRALNFSDFPTSSVIPGEYINPTVTVNAQGIITSIFSDTGGGGLDLFIPWTHVTGTPTTIAGYGITDPLVYTTGTYTNPSWIVSLDYSKITGTATGVTAGSYTNADITVGADGRIITASNGVVSIPTLNDVILSGNLTENSAEWLDSISSPTGFNVVNYDGITITKNSHLKARINGSSSGGFVQLSDSSTNIVKLLPTKLTTNRTQFYQDNDGVIALLSDITGGTITSVSIASSNGFSGTSSGGATPVLTLSTTITGILKGNGTAISAATSGTDYENPLTFTSPLSRTSNTISIPVATTSVNGYLSSTDWTTFNNKLSSAIISLNSLTAATQTFTNDTNVTIVSSGTAHAITWSGTLADSRITSAFTWNAKQNALSGTGVVKSTTGTISYISGTSSQFIKGDGSLDSGTYGTVLSVSGTVNKITVTNPTTTPIIDIASTYVGQGSITTLGTITGGVWNAAAILPTFGGTGISTYVTGDIIYASATGVLSRRAIGSTGDVYTVSGGVGVWSPPAVSSITLTGDVTGSGTSAIATTLASVGTAGTYGSATQVPVLTVDAKGRTTGVANTTISGVSPGGSAGGDLTGTYPNPTLLRQLTPTAVKTTTYAASVNDFIPCDNTAGSFTVTLPTTPADKSIIGVKLITLSGTNTITISTGGSDVFNKSGGSTSLTLSILNQAVILQYKSSGGIWYVLSTDVPASAFILSGATAGGDLTGTYPNPTVAGSVVKSVVLNTTGVLYTNPVTFTTSGNTATGSLVLANQSANTFLAGPTSGGVTTPTFRAHVSADIPTLTGGQVGITGLSATGTPSSSTYLRGDNTWAIGAGSVSSVATDATLSGGPITSTGTLGINLSNSNTWLSTQTIQTNSLAAVITPGLTLTNTTAATSGSLQYPPYIYQYGQSYNGSSLKVGTRYGFRTISSGPTQLTWGIDATHDGGTTWFSLISLNTNGGTLVSGSFQGAAITNTQNTLIVNGAGGGSGTSSVTIQPISTNTATSGNYTGTTISNKYNQVSATTANYDFVVNRVETAVGSGTQRLASLQVGGVEKFGVDNVGNTTISGTTTHTGATTFNGSLNLSLNKKLNISTGTNAIIGVATLVSGTVTVSTTAVTISSIIWVQYQSGASLSIGVGSISTLRVSAQTAGTSFVIVGDTTAGIVNTTDNSSVQWWIVN